MFYRLLGMAVWKSAMFYVRTKLDRRPPARVLAALGGLLVVGAGAAVMAARRGGDAE